MNPKTLKQASILLIVPALCLLFLTASPAAAELIAESVEIPYQVNHSDRVAIGTVSDIEEHYDYTIFTITVEEWLYNPLPAETIKVRTETGTGVWTEDQPEFEENEEVLLMLKDLDLEDRLFKVSVEFPGKRPVSDRGAVIEELKVQGKWQEGNETGGDGVEGEPEEGDTGSVPESESTPFISLVWVLAAVVGVVFAIRRME
ncbi:hypothetical protein MSMTP_1878 [Methanosarcina sp. MTP4]|uniref:hypothetical protein n=1 Tax=Methanosarcina sp. MTP4 TaxID=1434100 RepID=UPI000615DE3F|nr:hypothetical protein [Methanosarcina sp. MTP4]AKB25347.1 hypothetical protein MSMTP_1878 [Methanosarcina sp. MTP4]